MPVPSRVQGHPQNRFHGGSEDGIHSHPCLPSLDTGTQHRRDTGTLPSPQPRESTLLSCHHCSAELSAEKTKSQAALPKLSLCRQHCRRNEPGQAPGMGTGFG